MDYGSRLSFANSVVYESRRRAVIRSSPHDRHRKHRHRNRISARPGAWTG